MMVVIRLALVAAALTVLTFPAHAEDRSVLFNCKTMVERAEKDAGSASAADVTRCRQVIREWALRDARTTVDQEGKPLK
jgi:hypothetical protein